MFRRLLIIICLFESLFYVPGSASAQTQGPVYIVQSGDSLSSIAARFNVSLTDLMAANNLSDPDQLAAGQELVIPGLEGVSGRLDTAVINFGDSYRSLIRRTQVPEHIFRKLNHLVSPSEFYVGASMIVPADQEEDGQRTRFGLSEGESLFEAAIRLNTDEWTLAGLNGLTGPWDALPGDALYTPGGNGDQTASGLPSAFISAEIRDLPLKQGGTAVITVKAAEGVSLGGILVDHQLHFFSGDNETQVALQGIHALLEPGVYPLRIDAALPDGSTQSYEQKLVVISGNYPEDPLLYVDPMTIDPASTESENQALLEIVTAVTSQRLWSDDFLSPASLYAESTFFTSRYGNRRTYIGQGTDLEVQGFHTGLDFGGGIGLPITAPAAGKVVFAAPLTVRGNATIIDHGWGIFSGFWHQSKFNVQVGDAVEQGQVIGEVGGTGRVTGAHLHWELWVNGVQVDPLDWLSETYP